MSILPNVIQGLKRRAEAVLSSTDETWQSNLSIFFEYINENTSLKGIFDELKASELPDPNRLYEMFLQRKVSFSLTYRERVRECISLLLDQLDGKSEHAPWSLMSRISPSKNIDVLTREFYKLVFSPVLDYIVEKIEDSAYVKENKNDPSTGIDGKEIFISYSNRDKDKAGKITSLLQVRGFVTFLAHENIDINEVWRNEIQKHLDTCRGLVAVVTDDFLASCWTHQECGYVMGAKKPIVSLFYSSNKSGFLESRQGITMLDKTLEKVIDEVAQFFTET